MIAALHSSREDGTKDFLNSGIHFGWESIIGVYKADLLRAKYGQSRLVPKLEYSFVIRDSWTRLNVFPAKIMQVYTLYHYQSINLNVIIAAIHDFSC